MTGTGRQAMGLSTTLCAALLLAGLGGCDRWVEDMFKQPKYLPGRPAPLFPDGLEQRPPPPGAVAHAAGPGAATSSGRQGAELVEQAAQAERAMTYPRPVTQALLARGQERYTIYCMPCHSPVGDGDGWIVRRGFPAPPTYHSDRLRQAGDRHFYDVISHGYGIMYSYADRLTPEDRWAVVAFIRALQTSQHVQVSALPDALRRPLEKEAP